MLFARLLTLVALLFSWSSPALAQSSLLTGQVRAQKTKAPIPFVNIGIKGKNTGTAADERGMFSLRVPANLADDTLTFSAIGYQEQALVISQLAASQSCIILLAEKIAALPEVVVQGRAEQTRRIGTTTHNPFLWGNIATKETHDIVEFAKLISLTNTPSQLVQAHIFLRRPAVDTVTFRLNFYRVAQGLPAERLVEQTILVRTAIRDGWLTIDLTRYALTLQANFYLGFEFLPGNLPEKQLSVPAFSYGAQFGGTAIVRTSSLGTWRREPGATLSAYVTVKQ